MITELGVFDFDKANPDPTVLPVLSEIAPGVTLDEVQEATGMEFTVAEPLKVM